MVLSYALMVVIFATKKHFPAPLGARSAVHRDIFAPSDPLKMGSKFQQKTYGIYISTYANI